MSSTVNSTRSVVLASGSKGVLQKTCALTSTLWREEGSRRWMALPTRVQRTSGEMFERARADLVERQTRSSLQMGEISTEYVNL